MAIFRDTNHLPDFRKAVVTIGTFDGVHMGHRAIISEVARHAEEIEGESVLLTFHPHPRKVLFPGEPLGIITPLDRKLQLIADTGIKHVVVVPFDMEFAALSAADYIEHFLVSKFRPASIVIGYDHHFGHDRAGNIKLLQAYSATNNYEVVEIPARLIDDAAVSSTKIRKALLNGHVAEANHMLGTRFAIRGRVVAGKQLGRTIGYPTANILPVDPDQVVPGNGIYAVRVRYHDAVYGGMMSIGLNPTVSEDNNIKVEVHIFDFQTDIYGLEIEVEFLDRLRDEEKFTSVDQLAAQLALDQKAAMQILAQ